MNMVTKNAQTTAIEADSLAVNTPERMPPKMMTMVIRPHMASAQIFSACFIGMTSPLGNSWRAVNRHRQANVSPSSSLAAPAMNSAASTPCHRLPASTAPRCGWGNQDGLNRAADGDRRGEGAWIALLFHFRNQHRADGGGVCHRGARNRAEKGGRQDVDQ